MKKSEALRKAAKRIKHRPYDFDWFITERCNCGILAQVVLGLTESELTKTLGSDNCGTWRIMALRTAEYQSYWGCPSTGLGMVKVFTALYDMGFTREELNDLEHLVNKRYCDDDIRPDDAFRNYTYPKSVAAYMNNWAQALEKENL